MKNNPDEFKYENLYYDNYHFKDTMEDYPHEFNF